LDDAHLAHLIEHHQELRLEPSFALKLEIAEHREPVLKSIEVLCNPLYQVHHDNHLPRHAILSGSYRWRSPRRLADCPSLRATTSCASRPVRRAPGQADPGPTRPGQSCP